MCLWINNKNISLQRQEHKTISIPNLRTKKNYFQLEVWGSSGPRLLAGGPLGLLTSSFAPFERSRRVTQGLVIRQCVSLWIACQPLDSVLAVGQCGSPVFSLRNRRRRNYVFQELRQRERAVLPTMLTAQTKGKKVLRCMCELLCVFAAWKESVTYSQLCHLFPHL